MQENDYKPVVTITQVSEFAGIIFCIAGALISLGIINSGALTGSVGIAMALSNIIPTLAGGLLLIVAGRILRVLTDNSNAQAELPREKD